MAGMSAFTPPPHLGIPGAGVGVQVRFGIGGGSSWIFKLRAESFLHPSLRFLPLSLELGPWEFCLCLVCLDYLSFSTLSCPVQSSPQP